MNKASGGNEIPAESESCSVTSNSLQPYGQYCPWNSPGQNSGVSIPSPGDLPNPGIKPRSPISQVDSLPAEPQGKPKNTGVGRLSLLQWIFLNQELNWGLLHCRWIFYQLRYQVFPDLLDWEVMWALGNITMNKPSGGDGIPAELFQTLKDGSVKILPTICQQIWKTQQWPQDWKSSLSFHSQRKPKPKNVYTTAQFHSSHMLAKQCSKASLHST